MLEPIETVAALRARLGVPASSSPAERIALVPTMGALHDGHAELIRAARRDCDVVVVSIFVNALQFDRADDLARYPRTLERDLEICRDLDVNIVFAPPHAEMYPQPVVCTVDVGRLSDHLCGRFRPGHFGGVATVVLKLLQIASPSRAYFGEKDAQQLAIVRRMVSDFNIPVEIVGVPTVRETDGLAMSSRNRHLGREERLLAPSLYRALLAACRSIAAGEQDPASIRRAATAQIPESPAVKLEYLEIVHPVTLQPFEAVATPARVAGAMWVGSTRLIDNVLCTA